MAIYTKMGILFINEDLKEAMCLAIDLEATEDYRWTHRKEKWVNIWKVVLFAKGVKEFYPEPTKYKYYTPYQLFGFNKKLTATGKVDISIGTYPGNNYLDGGAIHCYKTRKAAYVNFVRGSEKVIKCRAKMSNFLYCGTDDEICFKEIEVV